jgi:hypothetical protein
MTEKESYANRSLPEIREVIQEAFTKFVSTPEVERVSSEEFETCLRTLTKLWQAPRVSPMDISKSALPELAQKSIEEKLNWIDGRFSATIENLENEAEIGLTLLQSRRMLREQIWPYCATSPCHKRLLTLLINSIDRLKPKSIAKGLRPYRSIDLEGQLTLLREKISLLSTKELTIEMVKETEDALLTIE